MSNNSQYYADYGNDSDYYFYYVPRYELGLEVDTSYVYVLSNNSDPINNSNGQLEKDIENGLYDIVTADTTGIITQAEADSDNFRRIEQNLQETKDNQQTFQNTMLDTEISQDTNNNIDNNLNFNNNNNLDSAYTGYFSRLTSFISSLGDYDLSTITSINLPIPHSSSSVSISSDLISSHLPSAISTIVTAFWLFIFSKYYISFIIKIYKLIVTGDILQNSNTSHEVITNDVL